MTRSIAPQGVRHKPFVGFHLVHKPFEHVCNVTIQVEGDNFKGGVVVECIVLQA